MSTKGITNDGHDVMWEVQRGLSKAQALPIVGPILVSPVKAVVSLVEMVAGLIIGFITGVLSALSYPISSEASEYLADKCVDSVVHFGLGFAGLNYSIANILTLGLFGSNSR